MATRASPPFKPPRASSPPPNHSPGFVNVFPIFRPGVPQLYLDADCVKVRSIGAPLGNVFDTL